MKHLFTQTKREMTGTIDGINLFFGALIGANLGTTDTMPAWSYAQLVTLLAGFVMTIRLVSVSERRLYAYGTLAVYVGLVLAVLLLPNIGIDGLAANDLNRLILTLSIWLGATMLVEFIPIQDPAAPVPPSNGA